MIDGTAAGKHLAVKHADVAKRARRVLFLVPPNITFEDFVDPPANVSAITKGSRSRQYGPLVTDVPLGIVSLSAYLKKFAPVVALAIDFNVELYRSDTFEFGDFKTYFCKHLASNECQTFAPDFVAISAQFTPTYNSVIDLADSCRFLFPGAMILAGGNLPTSMYRECLEDSPEIDAICYGEGEKAMLGLIQAERADRFLESCDTWITRKKLLDPGFTPAKDFILELDEIPFLDYDILDLEGYRLNPTSSHFAVSENYIAREARPRHLGKGPGEGDAEGQLSLPIMTSRGCPYHCTFCAAHNAHGRQMRRYSVKRVAQDLAIMKQKYGISGVVIQDDHFMGGKERPYEIVRALKDLGLKMFFQNALAIFALDPPFLALLKEAGVHELILPIESGSERVLREVMRKPLKLDMVAPVLANCRNAGIFTDCNIIVGMPGETPADLSQSREYLKTIYADWFSILIAMPIPGSEMFGICEANSYFKTTPLRANYKRAVIETEHMTAEYVQYMAYLMNIELNFVFNSNLRLGNFALALESFGNVVRVKPDHAIAHYYAGLCLENLGDLGGAAGRYRMAASFASATDFWNDFLEIFHIPLHDAASRLRQVVN